ncbi:MAG TPA: DUF423 domain-containing protein [Bacteroidia bacterium]|nr:DUF423 domain-containing protein [Bacteroidia bacterium]
MLIISSISGLLCVVLGAFGAHQLKAVLPADQLSVFETAVRYQFYHTFALLAVAILDSDNENKFLKRAAYTFITGIILFSGSLYLLSIRSLLGAEMRWLGPVTPLGGLFFMIGWLMLFLFAVKKK